MMAKGSAAARLHAQVRRKGLPIVSRSDVLKLARGISHPDRAIARLESEGLVEKLDRGLWLVPSHERPTFEIPRYWSNPALQDPLTISALVVSNPTVRDIARAIVAYGRKTVDQALDAAVSEGVVPLSVEKTARRMISNAWKGIADAARHRVAT